MQTEQAKRSAYAIGSAALLAPILAWPWMWSVGAFVEMPSLQRMWLAAASSLLCAAAAADSSFGLRAHFASIAAAVGWVVLAMGVSVFALRAETGGAWLLAAGFALHAVRTARRLWQGADDWLCWIGWARDIVAACALFGWSVRLS